VGGFINERDVVLGSAMGRRREAAREVRVNDLAGGECVCARALSSRGVMLAGADAYLALHEWLASGHVQCLGDAKQVLLADMAKVAVEELEGGCRSRDSEHVLWDLSGDVLNIKLHEKKPIARSHPEDGLAGPLVMEQAARAVDNGLPILTNEGGDGEKVLGEIGNIKYIANGEEDELTINHSAGT